MGPTNSSNPANSKGLVAQGKGTLQSRPYQLHVQEAKAMGQQPMTPEQFLTQGR